MTEQPQESDALEQPENKEPPTSEQSKNKSSATTVQENSRKIVWQGAITLLVLAVGLALMGVYAMGDFMERDDSIDEITAPMREASGTIQEKEITAEYCPSGVFVHPVNEEERGMAEWYGEEHAEAPEGTVCLDSYYTLTIDGERIHVEPEVHNAFNAGDEYTFDESLISEQTPNVRTHAPDVENTTAKSSFLAGGIFFMVGALGLYTKFFLRRGKSESASEEE